MPLHERVITTIALAAAMTYAGAGTALAQEPEQAEAAPEAESAVEVTRAVVATGVEDREPVGEATTFPAEVGTVYFYTVFEGDFPESGFEHVWLRDGEEIARVPVRAAGPRWRTWTSKTIPADWTGAWTVRVVDGDGTELASVDFTVGGG